MPGARRDAPSVRARPLLPWRRGRADNGANRMSEQLAEVFARHGRERSDLIPVLQEAQEEMGYLPRETMLAIARHLRIPASSVYGVATFYAQFYLEPRGRHRLLVCRRLVAFAGQSVDGVLQPLDGAEDDRVGDVQRLIPDHPGEVA